MKVAAFTVKSIRRTRLVLAMVIMTSIGSASAAEPVNTLEKTLLGYKPNGIAIRGYDPVAYFMQGKPVMGNSQYPQVVPDRLNPHTVSDCRHYWMDVDGKKWNFNKYGTFWR